jgi:hypothetical protein
MDEASGSMISGVAILFFSSLGDDAAPLVLQWGRGCAFFSLLRDFVVFFLQSHNQEEGQGGVVTTRRTTTKKRFAYLGSQCTVEPYASD